MGQTRCVAIKIPPVSASAADDMTSFMVLHSIFHLGGVFGWNISKDKPCCCSGFFFGQDEVSGICFEREDHVAGMVS